jgi:acyl-CoA synthetase (NDP forming)
MENSETDNGTVFRSVDTVLKPRSVAIVGASDRGASGWSNIIFDCLRQAGFPADVHLINPRRDRLWDQVCYPNFGAIGKPVDHALMLVPAKLCVAALEDAAKHGVRSATIYSADFGEGESNDEEAAARGEAVKALSEKYGIRICGPNCMGGVAVREGITLYPAKRVHNIPAGTVGGIFQSGGTLQFWLEQAVSRGLGFSYAVTVGNQVDLDFADFLNFYIEDESTKVIVCLIEGVRRPTAFMKAAAKALAARKPVLVVKIGRTEEASAGARSHTGSLAGDDAVFDAFCRRYGVVRCDDLASMVEMAMVFSQNRLPAGNRMGLVTTSGAVKGLCLDAKAGIESHWGTFSQSTKDRLAGMVSGVSKIENPLDTGPAMIANPAAYGEICQTMLADDGIDMLALLSRTPLSESQPGNPEPFAQLAASTTKPIFAFAHMARPDSDYSRAFQKMANMPFIHGIPQALMAMGALARYGAVMRRGIPEVPKAQGAPSDVAPEAIKRILSDAGVPIPKEKIASSIEEAQAAADDIGFPVALKLISPQASHKTEVGGVKLNLCDAEAVRAAAEEIVAGLDNSIVVEGFQVQEMVSGLEVIAGFRVDPQYGPYAVVGLGGVWVEALRDTSLRLLPVAPEEVREMIAGLRSSALFGEFRKQPARDVDALVKAVSELGNIFLNLEPWLQDLEVNPLVIGANGQGVRAVDVRLVEKQSNG